MRVRFCIRTPSVPRASIIWLAPAVKVVLPAPVASTLTAFASPTDGTQESRSESACLVLKPDQSLPVSSCGEFQRKDSLLLNQIHNGFQRVFGFVKGNIPQARIG